MGVEVVEEANQVDCFICGLASEQCATRGWQRGHEGAGGLCVYQGSRFKVGVSLTTDVAGF